MRLVFWERLVLFNGCVDLLGALGLLGALVCWMRWVVECLQSVEWSCVWSFGCVLSVVSEVRVFAFRFLSFYNKFKKNFGINLCKN